MRFLYIGQYSEGTTSRMRGEYIKRCSTISSFDIIDLNDPFYKCSRIWRSLAFRFKVGKVIWDVNQFILDNLGEKQFDIIWVDKGNFIKPRTIKTLKLKSKKLIHFTPDPAFTYHRSRYFHTSLPLFDFVITTKIYEKKYYLQKVKGEKLLYCTQGYDPLIHKEFTDFGCKKKGVVFIGHYEKEREIILQYLLDKGIRIGLAGIKWNSFIEKNKNNSNLEYFGSGVYGQYYSKLISSYHFSIGFLSKWIPELHTTRTFEIPACGTALITERNAEIESFYSDGDVIFYNSKEEIVGKIKYYLSNLSELETLTVNGSKKVENGGYDYETLMLGLLKKINA